VAGTANASASEVRVLRIIARLNVGGPAIQAISLSRLLGRSGYRTLLLRGQEGPREGSMDHLARAMGVQPIRVPGLRRGVGPHDLRALFEIMRWIHRVRPNIVHTHTAKAGALGRLAVLLSPWARPSVVIHTFHGHVLRGEFSPVTSKLVALVERTLARLTTRLIAVSQEIKDDLVEFRVASPDKIEVVHLGFDLSRFAAETDRKDVRQRFRARFGIPDDAMVVALIARVVKVKRVDRFLSMAVDLAARDDTWFLVAGDGDKRPGLEVHPMARRLGERLVWTGFQEDIRAVCFASDVVVLTSDNEGTPVCLIEAQAAALPVVTTDVGGVETVVADGHTGRIVATDHAELANAVAELLDDPEKRTQWGAAGRTRALATFGIDRLVADIEDLYRRTLEASRP
jgi:glycosyltransferase involved in cell wall biosynthesis